jgi:hypothetical protein
MTPPVFQAESLKSIAAYALSGHKDLPQRRQEAMPAFV